MKERQNLTRNRKLDATLFATIGMRAYSSEQIKKAHLNSLGTCECRSAAFVYLCLPFRASTTVFFSHTHTHTYAHMCTCTQMDTRIVRTRSRTRMAAHASTHKVCCSCSFQFIFQFELVPTSLRAVVGAACLQKNMKGGSLQLR